MNAVVATKIHVTYVNNFCFFLNFVKLIEMLIYFAQNHFEGLHVFPFGIQSNL